MTRHHALLQDAIGPRYTAFTSPVNLAGLPALALPVPTGQRLPASLQLIGGPGAEALLLATGAIIEAAAQHWLPAGRPRDLPLQQLGRHD